MLEKLRQASETHRQIKELITRAAAEARQLGAPALEAEHLLLALVDAPDPAAGVLSSLGFSRERIIQGLDRELATALARARVRLAQLPPPPARPPGRHLPWGQSARRAAERSIEESPADPSLRMLLAIVHAEGGVIPRLLAELRVRVEDVEAAVSRAA